MESREARVGTLVRLLDGGKRSGKGRVGTIERTYGHPDYLAMEVRFADGDAELAPRAGEGSGRPAAPAERLR